MIDLHTHTNASDGSFAPCDLVAHARQLGFAAIAITDHDTFDGYDEAVLCEAAAEISLLCGVELSTHAPQSTRSVHLLAYFFDAPAPAFREWLRSLQQGRRDRNVALCDKLCALGMPIRYVELERIAGRQIGRPHFARLMVEKGYVDSIRTAFERYLGDGREAWVGRDEPALAEAVERVADAGGLPGLAHPSRIGADPAVLDELVASLVPRGLAAIECYHPELTAADTEVCLAIAERYALAVTGGSDFHGAYKPEIELGTGRGRSLHVPPDLLAALRRRYDAAHC